MKRRKENVNNIASALFLHSRVTHWIFILVLISSFVTNAGCRRHRDAATNSVGIMTEETLNFKTNPQVVILLNKTTTEFTVKLDKNYAPDPNIPNYKLSVSLEILNVNYCNQQFKLNWAKNSEGGMKVDQTYFRGVSLQADPEKNTTTPTLICESVDYTSNYFQNTKWFLIGDRSIKISVGNGWVDGDEAQLVATVFYEKNSCDGCEVYTFCCEDDSFNSFSSDETSDLYGISSDILADAEGVRYGPEFYQLKGPADSDLGRDRDRDRDRNFETSHKKVHCIPLITVCNKHGNCAMKNNDDEEDTTCFCYNWTSPCMSYQFLWTALLAIVFFILAPTSIVFLICYHRQMRNFRQRIAENSVTVSSPVNDLPPTYEEIEEPPPCFCYAIAAHSDNGVDPALVLRLGLTSSEPDGGLDNPGFTPHPFPVPVPVPVTCTCGQGRDRDTDTGPKSISSDETDPGWNSGPSRFSMRALIARVRPSLPGSIFRFIRGRRDDEEQTGDRTVDGNSNRNLSQDQSNNNYYNNHNRSTSTSQRQNSIVNSNYGNIGV